MSFARPFAYNTGSTISGTEQLGDLAIGVDDLDYTGGVGGVTWWNGPDEDLGRQQEGLPIITNYFLGF